MLIEIHAGRNATHARVLAHARQSALVNAFVPRGTVRCRGDALFSGKAARDAACLLDLDASVIAWTCMPIVLERNRRRHVPDFLVERHSGTTVIDVVPLIGPQPPKWIADASRKLGHAYEAMLEASFKDDLRLVNARELLRYANWQVPLGDRIRLLAFLDERGPAPLATCMSVLANNRDPVGAIASLALRRFVEMDIDDMLLGPDTIVSRFRD